MTDPITLFSVGFALIVFVLFRIAWLLQDMKETLTKIAEDTHDSAVADATYLSEIKFSASAIRCSTDETKELLERAIKKQWGSAIDLGDERSMAVNPSTPVIAPPSPDAPLRVWLAYRADLQPLAHL